MENEFDVKEYDYKVLEFLRKETVLGPIALIKIKNAKNIAEKVRNIYRIYEHANVGVDFSLANELEMNYRLRALQKKLYTDWEMYGEGLDIEEYTDRYIRNNMEKAKVKVL